VTAEAPVAMHNWFGKFGNIKYGRGKRKKTNGGWKSCRVKGADVSVASNSNQYDLRGKREDRGLQACEARSTRRSSNVEGREGGGRV